MTVFNGAVYFNANDGSSGIELWKSDGTAAGTAMVKDINPGSADGYPSGFTIYDGGLYFRASDASHGYELWQTDGSADGTVQVKDINPGGDSTPQNLFWFHATGTPVLAP